MYQEQATTGIIFFVRFILIKQRAHGYGEYGPKYEAEIMEKVRKGVEACDSLQCFLLFHSLGGGTGSGVGSYLVESNTRASLSFCLF